MKLGGCDRQGSAGVRGRSGSSSAGTLMALRVSGVSRPGGTFRGGRFLLPPPMGGSRQLA